LYYIILIYYVTVKLKIQIKPGINCLDQGILTTVPGKIQNYTVKLGKSLLFFGLLQTRYWKS